MKKPEETKDEFSEFMWMAEEDPDDVDQQVEDELQLIEQDFLEAMFEQMLLEEDEKESYYGPSPDDLISQAAGQTAGDPDQDQKSMELPVITSNLNPNAPEFVPRFAMTASS